MDEWTMESVLVALGEDAQVVPGGVIKHHLCADGQQRNVLIATYDNGVFAMTPEGRGVLAEWADEPVSATPAAPAPRKRRTKAEMEAARAAVEPVKDEESTVGEQLELPPDTLLDAGLNAGLDLDADLDLDLDFPSDTE